MDLQERIPTGTMDGNVKGTIGRKSYKEVGSSVGLQRKVKGTSEAVSFETLSKSFLVSAQSCQIRKVFTLLTILKTRPK